MRRTRYLILLIAIYLAFIGGSSRYVTLYQVRVLHHIVVTVILGLWLVQRIIKGKGIPHTPLNFPLFALISAWGISALTALDPRMALENIWFPLTFIIIFFVVVDYFQRGLSKIIMEAFFFVLLIVLFLTLLEIASWYFGLNILPGTGVGWYEVGIHIPPSLPKVSMALGISTLVAGFTVPCLFITITWAMTVRFKSYRRILWIIAFFLFLTLILTFSRGGLLAFIGGLATFFIIRAVQHPALTSRISAKWVGGFGSIVAISIMLGFVALTLPFAIGRSDKGRLDMWQSAVKITVDHPITGVGPGLFGRAYRDYRDPLAARDKLASAHNFYLNTVSELGVIGMIVGIWLAFTLLKSSWQTWKNAKGKHQRLRVEGMFAALAALAVHSMVDVFTITPINLVFIVIVAYLISGHRSILDARPAPQLKPAYVFLALIVIYGFAQLQWDRAQGYFQSSFTLHYNKALNAIKEAQAIDPHLNLYHLHEAFITGRNANSPEAIQSAITMYEQVLELEPTWDIGWINLASLELQQGNIQTAIDYLYTAHTIYPQNSAIFAYAHTADIYDQLDDQIIIDAYKTAIRFYLKLPLADVWWQTPLASTATRQFLETRSIEHQYRVFRIHAPESLPDVVPDNPTTAVEWWVIGQEALKNNQLKVAGNAFAQAINLKSTNGDYYVSRAQTYLDQPDLAQRNLQLAKLYGTTYEYPDLTLALFAETEESATRLRANAIPTRPATQEFAAVLYTRPAIFDAPRNMRYPGLGETTIQPWYDIAESYIADNDLEAAINAYEFILEFAPYEQKAQKQLEDLKLRTDS